MSIIDHKRHFYSDCQNFLDRYYKEQNELNGLVKLFPNSKHIKSCLEQTKKSIKLWEQRRSDAWNDLEVGIGIWIDWVFFIHYIEHNTRPKPTILIY